MADFERPTWPVVAALMILLVLMAGFIPSIFLNTQDTETQSVSQTLGETEAVKAPLYSTITDINQNSTKANNDENNTVTLFLTDKQTGNSTSKWTLREGQSVTVSLSGETIEIVLTRVSSTEKAVIEYTLPVSFGWNDTATAFVSVIGLILLVLFLYLIFVLIQPGVNI